MLYRIFLIFLIACLPIGFLHSFTLFLLTTFILLPLLFLGLTYYLRLPKASSKYANEFKNIIIAHRGGQPVGVSPAEVPVFPENTLAAFRWCSKNGGCDAFELDVWLSKDGVPMVNHDPNIFRHFDGEGTINSMTMKQLKSIKYLAEPHFPPKLTSAENAYEKQEIKQHRTVIDPKYIQSERMPTLEEVVQFLADEAPHMKCMIEVKERYNVKAMCQALKVLYDEHPWMYSRCFVASFNPFILYHLRLLDPDIVTSFLFIDNWTSHLLKNAADMKIVVPGYLKYNYPLRWLIDDGIWSLGTTAYGLSLLGANLSACEVKALTQNQIKYDRDHGILTSTWVANNEQQKEWLLQQGVTVITDTQFTGGATSTSPRPQHVF